MKIRIAGLLQHVRKNPTLMRSLEWIIKDLKLISRREWILLILIPLLIWGTWQGLKIAAQGIKLDQLTELEYAGYELFLIYIVSTLAAVVAVCLLLVGWWSRSFILGLPLGATTACYFIVLVLMLIPKVTKTYSNDGILMLKRHLKTVAEYPFPGHPHKAQVVESLYHVLKNSYKYFVVVRVPGQNARVTYSSETAEYWGMNCGKPARVEWQDKQTLRIDCSPPSNRQLRMTIHQELQVTPKHDLMRYYQPDVQAKRILLAQATESLENAQNLPKVQEALGYFERIVQMAPDEIPSYLGILRAQYKLGYLKSDSLEAKTLPEIEHFVANGYYRAGLLKMEDAFQNKMKPSRSLLKKARREFEKALQADPGHLKAQQELRVVEAQLAQLKNQKR
jgi:hypothetical protein